MIVSYEINQKMGIREIVLKGVILVGKIETRLRSIFLCFLYGFKGKRIKLGKNVKILNPQFVDISDDTQLDDGVELSVADVIGGIVPRLIIGKKCRLNRNSIVGCANLVILEDSVRIAPYVHISDRNHSYTDVETPINIQPIVTQGPVIIKSQAWLGFGVQVMSGVTIGIHSIVAAGSVVTKSIPDYCVAAGNPARVIKRYNSETKHWDKV